MAPLIPPSFVAGRECEGILKYQHTFALTEKFTNFFFELILQIFGEGQSSGRKEICLLYDGNWRTGFSSGQKKELNYDLVEISKKEHFGERLAHVMTYFEPGS